MKYILKNEKTNKKIPKLLKKVHQLIFLTSGQCFIFDKEGNQIPELQVEFANGEANLLLLKDIAEHTEKFAICKFREWMQEMNKEDFFRITNLNSINK